jgi:hypothetical protein
VSRQLVTGLRLDEPGQAGWHVPALELWRLWQSRPKLRKRALALLVWRFVPLKLKLAAVGAAALALLLFAGAVGALLFGLSQVV